MTRLLLAGIVACSLPRVGACAEPKAGEEREFEIVKGVKMKFCWIPAGEATLGSPATEDKREKDREPEHKFTTKGFWLGKYEVTQREWAGVGAPREKPNYFSADGGGKDRAEKDTSEYPVEEVSWDECQGFVKKVNEFASVKGFEFKLPHEDEWEYACRGGKGNKQAFYFGTVLNGDKANCDGKFPYGTDKQGKLLDRPAKVGSYQEKAPHPWGLCDMHGNVWEWCDNDFPVGSMYRAFRGGGYYDTSWDCRSASRYWHLKSDRHRNQGLRLALVPVK